MLTPFKLLPFFPVRVRLGVVVVNRDLVEVLARVRVVREHVGWGHPPINDSEWWSGWGDGFSVCGKFADADQRRLSLLGKQCHWRSAIHAGQVRTIVEASPLPFFASPFCLYSSLSQPSPLFADDSAPQLAWPPHHLPGKNPRGSRNTSRSLPQTSSISNSPNSLRIRRQPIRSELPR